MAILPEILQKETQSRNTNILKESTIEKGTTNIRYYNGNNVATFENAFKLPASAIYNATKNYKFIYNEKISTIIDTFVADEDKEKFEKSLDRKEFVQGAIIDLQGAPSLFNPLFGVHVVGINTNTPLTNEKDRVAVYDGNTLTYEDLSDCSIKTLVNLSQTGKLGRSTYRYADFMYCKDLGKIPNNRLITLRRFSMPIGDDIWHIKGLNGIEENDILGVNIPQDIGHLVTWLNDDNKLEDILKYDYKDSWKQMKGEYQDVQSQSENNERGIIGSIVNLANPTFRKQIGTGYAGSGNRILGAFSTSVGNGKIFSNQAPYQDHTVLTRYDQYRIYEPQGTIRDTHKWEGEMTFTHNFTLVFNYELRAYDNINPRTAFYDLLGNIQQVTYRKGNFWGGAPWFIGAPENKAGWQKAESLIDGTIDKVSDTFSAIFNNDLSIGDLLGNIANKVGNAIKGIVGGMVNAAKNPQQTLEKVGEKAKEYNAKIVLTGLLKNGIGRPSLYALNSYLDGQPTGIWHVTIGNPRNPIMSIGNLVMDGATVQHYGPLGIDDFPTGLKVTVNLKHGKSRDSMEIGKMYTMGTFGLYMSLTKNNPAEKFIDFSSVSMNASQIKTNFAATEPSNG